MAIAQQTNDLKESDMSRSLSLLWRGIVLLALLSLDACASAPQKAPDCHGAYTPINTPDHYAPEKKAP